MVSYSEQTKPERQKRDLKYIKNLVVDKLFGSKTVKTLPTPPLVVKQLSGDYKILDLPKGYKLIHIKSIDKSNISADIQTIPLRKGILETYLGTRSPQETQYAFQGLPNLLQSGILHTPKEVSDASKSVVKFVADPQPPDVELKIPYEQQTHYLFVPPVIESVPFTGSQPSPTYEVPRRTLISPIETYTVPVAELHIPSFSTKYEVPNPINRYSYKQIKNNISANSYNSNDVKFDHNLSATSNIPVSNAVEAFKYPPYVIPAAALPPRTSYDIPIPQSFVTVDNNPKFINELPILPQIHDELILPKVDVKEFHTKLNEHQISDLSNNFGYSYKQTGNNIATNYIRNGVQVNTIPNVLQDMPKIRNILQNRIVYKVIKNPLLIKDDKADFNPSSNPYNSRVDVHINKPLKYVNFHEGQPFVYKYIQTGEKSYQSLVQKDLNNQNIVNDYSNRVIIPQIDHELHPPNLNAPQFDVDTKSNENLVKYLPYNKSIKSTHSISLKENPIVVLPQKGNNILYKQSHSNGYDTVVRGNGNDEVVVDIKNSSNNNIHRGDVP